MNIKLNITICCIQAGHNINQLKNNIIIKH